MAAAPAVRETGQGDAVICLHCSPSSGGQWRTLGDWLARRLQIESFLGEPVTAA
jgi:hypothetical protein